MTGSSAGIDRLAPWGLAALGLSLGLWGLRWGLPERGRIEHVLPPRLDAPAFHERLAASWVELHKRLGANLMINPDAGYSLRGYQRSPAGWSEPPDILLGPYRSFYIRSAHEDEQTMFLALARMKPWKLQLNGHMFTYGGAYLYTLGAWEALGAALGFVELHASISPYLAEPARMAAMYAWGRLMTVLAAVGAAWLLLRIGRRRLGAEAGALAGVLFLLAPGVQVQAHVMKNHPFWTCLALWTLDLSLGLLAEATDMGWAAAGAAAGLTVGAFLNAWTVCFVPAAAAGVRLGLRRASWRGELRGLCIAGACAAGAFLATNPCWLTSPAEGLAEMRALSSVSAFDLAHPALFLWRCLLPGVTAPVFALTILGAIWAAWRGRREPALLLTVLAFILGLSVTVTTANVGAARMVRYGLGWLAVGNLLASRLFVDLWRARARWRPALGALLAAALLHEGLTAATYCHNFRMESTPRSAHALAGEWIEAHIPAGASIGMLNLPQPSNAPFFRYDRYDLRFVEAGLFGGLRPAELPSYLSVVTPDHDDRPGLEPNLSRYERIAVFERPRLVPWIAVDPGATTAGPLIEVYRLMGRGA